MLNEFSDTQLRLVKEVIQDYKQPENEKYLLKIYNQISNEDNQCNHLHYSMVKYIEELINEEIIKRFVNDEINF